MLPACRSVERDTTAPASSSAPQRWGDEPGERRPHSGPGAHRRHQPHRHRSVVRQRRSSAARLPGRSSQRVLPRPKTGERYGASTSRELEQSLQRMGVQQVDLIQLHKPGGVRGIRVWQLLAPWIGPTDAEIVRAVVYRFHATVAERMRERRVFLAGEASLDSAYGGQRPFPHLRAGFLAGDGLLRGRQVANVTLADGTRLDDVVGDGFVIVVDEPTLFEGPALDRWRTLGAAVVQSGALAKLGVEGAIVVRLDRTVAAVSADPYQFTADTEALMSLLG